MTALERDILQALIDLENAVKALPAPGPKPDLLPRFARIDQLRSRLPEDADPTLLHYLHKRSYQKARLWLEGREAENQAGSCRH